jgi:cytochrome oxidase Cu insertion factor (SCO1/SenC/PrrC family)
MLATAPVIALAAAVILSCSSSPSSSRGGASVGGSSNASAPGASGFDGAALPGDVAAPDFTLTDQHGHRVSLSHYRGQVTVLAFLYSSCGGPCIVIAQQIRGALDELARPAAVVIVSADPTADTPASVARFLRRVSLTGRVRYLTGSASQLRPVWRAYRVVPASAGRGSFARAATVALLDRQGRERVLFGPEQLTPESLAHDVRRLQRG